MLAVEFLISGRAHEFVAQLVSDDVQQPHCAQCFTVLGGPTTTKLLGRAEMGKQTAVGSNSTALVGADRIEWMRRRSLCSRSGLGHIFLAVKALERRAVRLE